MVLLEFSDLVDSLVNPCFNVCVYRLFTKTFHTISIGVFYCELQGTKCTFRIYFNSCDGDNDFHFISFGKNILTKRQYDMDSSHNGPAMPFDVFLLRA